MANKKFINGDTLDSKCVMHNDTLLSDILKMNISDITYTHNITNNWNDLYSLVGKGIKVFVVSVVDNIPTGYPLTAYPYGLLIVICGHGTGKWADAQIYIPDKVYDRGFYVRVQNQAWLHISGTVINVQA